MSRVEAGVAAFWDGVRSLARDHIRVTEERDRFRAALEVILEMPNGSLWADDRDAAADTMWETAKEALTPPKKRKRK